MTASLEVLEEMATTIDTFLTHSKVRPQNGAPPDLIATVAGRYGVELPRVLVEFWSRADGAAMESLDAHVLGPAEVLDLVSVASFLVKRGLLPFVDDHESNYLVLAVRPPLAYRVLYFPHDDGCRIVYRDFDSCLRGLVTSLEDPDCSYLRGRETQGDYSPEAPRSADDQAAARSLMSAANVEDEWNHAAQLLGSHDLQEWARLLETDHFVRRDALARMQKMSSPLIHELLQRDQAELETFIQWFIATAQTAGLPVEFRREDAIRIGGHWFIPEAFYFRRGVPDAGPRLVAWLQDSVAGRDPRRRPGNFMSDDPAASGIWSNLKSRIVGMLRR